ncbi:hypothetical protein EDC30_102267 [Paucimonas lemoignei]|uniref:Uncharacterized protein n=2 Tax=Paucimonas lemoignei TaxID=29443 RepID=A0A4R3HZ61_PAULE|nr:hypothetical protein EDC30_102267 [Paucimonas lemoignei]
MEQHMPSLKVQRELDDINEKLRKDVIRTIEPYGVRTIADLESMGDIERTKWFFWNMHENIDEIRKFEPALIGQVIRTQLTVSDGHSLWTEKCGLEKRIELSCKWQLLLKDGAYQSEESYALTDGWIDLSVGQCPPPHPVLQENQKGYLDSDSKLYPNQLFLYGWITDEVWQEIKNQLYNASANCHTDIFIRDNFLFPVKPGHNFVSGPAGSIGITNIEFRVSSQPRLTSWVKQ